MVVPIDTPERAKPICRPVFFSSTFSHLPRVNVFSTWEPKTYIKANPTAS